MSQCTGRDLKVEDVSERRSDSRDTIIFRVGLLNQGARPTFCLVKNISPTGAQVKLYGQVTVGLPVSLQIGDDAPVVGRVAWSRGDLAGIAFDNPVDLALLLRAAQKLAPTKRRSSPRVKTAARLVLRTNGRIYAAILCDISASGAQVRTFKPAKLGPAAVLTLPDLPPVKAYVKWTNDTHVGLSFAKQLPVELLADWLAGRLRACA